MFFPYPQSAMLVNAYDAHNKESITVDIEGPSYAQRIKGDGFFILVNPGSKYASFSKHKQGVCFGDITKNIIPDYTNQQFADEYGDRLTGLGLTVKEYMQNNCRMDIK